MNLGLSPADKKLLEEVIDPDVLAERVPYIKTALEGVEEMGKMMSEIGYRGRQTGIVGMTDDFSLQKVAHIPTHIATALLETDPDILTNKKKFYAWLKTPMGRACRYDRKTVKGA